MGWRSAPPFWLLSCLACLAASSIVKQTPLETPRHISDMSKLFKENLDVDIASWESKAPLKALDAVALYEHWAQIPAGVRIVLIYNNTWLHWDKKLNPAAKGVSTLCPDGPEALQSGQLKLDECDPQLRSISQAMHKALKTGLITLPNAVFVVNVEDGPKLPPGVSAKAPTFTLFKNLNPGQSNDFIVIPQMHWVSSVIHSYPWSEKSEKAFFSGTPYCGANAQTIGNMSQVCTRKYFAYRTQKDKGDVLQVGSLQDFSDMIAPDINHIQVNKSESVSVPDHAKYKYLLHFEGLTGSTRLSQLLHIDSLVLRAMESNWTEYFYRSLVPHKHYIPFWQKHRDDLFEVLEQVKELDRTAPHTIQSIINAANHFASKYTTMRAKLFYYQAAITKYKTLFLDMDEYIESELVPKLRAGGFDFNPGV